MFMNCNSWSIFIGESGKEVEFDIADHFDFYSGFEDHCFEGVECLVNAMLRNEIYKNRDIKINDVPFYAYGNFDGDPTYRVIGIADEDFEEFMQKEVFEKWSKSDQYEYAETLERHLGVYGYMMTDDQIKELYEFLKNNKPARKVVRNLTANLYTYDQLSLDAKKIAYSGLFNKYGLGMNPKDVNDLQTLQEAEKIFKGILFFETGEEFKLMSDKEIMKKLNWID